MYHYKRGEFLQAFNEPTTPKIYKLWSLLYTADKSLILDRLSRFIKEARTSNNNGVWDRRAYLYVQVMALTNNERATFLSTAEKLDGLVKADKQDGYFLSLGQFLKKLSMSDFPDFTSSVRNSHLIGDSHTLSLSMSWNYDKGAVSFLPAVTTRELSSEIKLPAHYAFENAIRLTIADRLVFSIGEIDQREIYNRIEAYSAQPSVTRERIRLQLIQSMASLRAMVSPFQDAFFLAMPPFFESLVPDHLEDRSTEIKDWIQWYGATFETEAKEQGFVVSGSDKMRNAQQQDLIDHAHFKPGFYENFFD